MASSRTGGRSSATKRARRAEAKEARERARRRSRRLAKMRAGALGVAGIFLVAAVGWFIHSRSVAHIPTAAFEAASAAGCGQILTPEGSAPGGQHLAAGQTYRYPQEPATSGPHDQSPLPPDPHVLTSPVPETQAVHNLEHGYIWIYYRGEGSDTLSADVVDRLASLAEGETKVLMAPHPNLSSGTGLALAAWNKLWECPASITADQAATVAGGLIQGYRGTSNAPEPRAA